MKFIQRLLIFFLIVSFTDYIVGYALKHYYFNQINGQSKSLTYVIKDCTADIVIFGPSTAQHHYNSKLIENKLQMTCYNAGIDGGHSILLPNAQIVLLTERYNPKLIIVDMRPDVFASKPSDYDKLSILAPYYEDYIKIRPIICLRNNLEFLKHYSKIYPYNSNIVNILRYNSKLPSAKKKDINGYIPLFGEMQKTEVLSKNEFIQNYSKADTNFLNALKNIINICAQKDITLLFVSSPVYNDFITLDYKKLYATKQVIKLLNTEKAIYIDFTNDTTFINRPEYFKDKGHLNNVGAEIFTSKIIELINNKGYFLKRNK